MKNKKKKSLKIRVLNSICAFVLLISVIFIWATGFDYISTGIMTAALISLATPVVLSGEGFIDVISGIFEAIFEGVLAIFEGIAEVISGIFS